MFVLKLSGIQKVLVLFFSLCSLTRTKTSIEIALSAKRGELFAREWERKRDSFGILYTGYLLSIVNIKRVIERESKERGKREIERRDRKKR